MHPTGTQGEKNETYQIDLVPKPFSERLGPAFNPSDILLQAKQPILKLHNLLLSVQILRCRGASTALSHLAALPHAAHRVHGNVQRLVRVVDVAGHFMEVDEVDLYLIRGGVLGSLLLGVAHVVAHRPDGLVVQVPYGVDEESLPCPGIVEAGGEDLVLEIGELVWGIVEADDEGTVSFGGA